MNQAVPVFHTKISLKMTYIFQVHFSKIWQRNNLEVLVDATPNCDPNHHLFFNGNKGDSRQDHTMQDLIQGYTDKNLEVNTYLKQAIQQMAFILSLAVGYYTVCSQVREISS